MTSANYFKISAYRLRVFQGTPVSFADADQQIKSVTDKPEVSHMDRCQGRNLSVLTCLHKQLYKG